MFDSCFVFLGALTRYWDALADLTVSARLLVVRHFTLFLGTLSDDIQWGAVTAPPPGAPQFGTTEVQLASGVGWLVRHSIVCRPSIPPSASRSEPFLAATCARFRFCPRCTFVACRRLFGASVASSSGVGRACRHTGTHCCRSSSLRTSRFDCRQLCFGGQFVVGMVSPTRMPPTEIPPPTFCHQNSTTNKIRMPAQRFSLTSWFSLVCLALRCSLFVAGIAVRRTAARATRCGGRRQLCVRSWRCVPDKC